jgi:protein-L-isoaspartate(D-aspartate) O-methyltransferase
MPLWPKHDDPATERARMVQRQLQRRGITDERVLAALGTVPREAFIAERLARSAYADEPLPIGHGQTISQPYVVAWMAEALDIGPRARVLEVGAGSGYAAAVLSLLAERVIAVERLGSLAAAARERLAALGYANVEVHHGDGTRGWPAAAPFDAILVSAAAARIPSALGDQLAIGGRLVIPVGGDAGQELLRLVKTERGGLEERRLGGVRFVPVIEGPEIPAEGPGAPDDAGADAAGGGGDAAR